jgi:hypothetical protein
LARIPLHLICIPCASGGAEERIKAITGNSHMLFITDLELSMALQWQNAGLEQKGWELWNKKTVYMTSKIPTNLLS